MVFSVPVLNDGSVCTPNAKSKEGSFQYCLAWGGVRWKFHAYQTRKSEISTGAVKSYLTYPYPTRGIDKNRITTRVVNTLVVYEVT